MALQEQLIPCVRHATKESIGLGNVDNTRDDEKPLSKKQREAIESAKQELLAAINEEEEPPTSSPSATFEHIQSSASTEWIINHNLGFMPLVTVIDDSGNAVDVEIFHVSVNQTRARFSAPQTGKARCI